MNEILNFILRYVSATLLICLINTILKLNIAYHWFYLTIVAMFGLKGLFIVFAFIYLL